MHLEETNKQKCLIWGIFFLVSLSVHIFCNIFSPILLPQLEPDQMMFYMAGKAWMNGMVPYVDFIDVKGPLLWLFYGIGYLITPDKTGGVYLLLVLSTTLTLWYIYKLSRTLNLTPKIAILACTISLFALFNFDTKGGRAEDIMHPFIAALLYYYVQYLVALRYNPEENTHSKLHNVAWAAGICISAAILTKFNNVITGCGVACLVLVSEWKRGAIAHFFTHFIPRFIGGILLLSIPFAILLSYYHSLDDFFQTYFLLNSQSCSFLFSTPLNCVFRTISFTLHDTKALILITGLFLLCSPQLFPVKKSDFYERLSLLFLLLITWIPNSIFHSPYYLIVCAPFFAFAAIVIAKHIHIQNKITYIALIVSILSTVVAFNGIWSKRCPSRLTQKMHKNISAIENELQSMPSPKIIYYGYHLDLGFGIKAGALPGCPFWCGLNGLWHVCRKEQNKSIIARIPDYIVCETNMPDNIPGHTSQFFHQNGYVKQGCYKIDDKAEKYATLYKKAKKHQPAPHS